MTGRATSMGRPRSAWSSVLSSPLAVLFAFALLVGCGRTSLQPSRRIRATVEKGRYARVFEAKRAAALDYLLHPSDSIDVRVEGSEFLSPGLMTLSAQGGADFPLLGWRHLAGLSVRTAEQRLRDEYTAALEREVDLRIELAAPPWILGEVARAGPLHPAKGLTLVEGISAAGGFTAHASGTVRLLRRNGEKRGVVLYEIYRIDTKAVAKGRLPDPLLQPYDIVWVSRR